MGGQRHVPATLPPGKTRYPLYRMLDGLQGRSGRVQKIQMRHTGWNSECIYHLSQISADFSLLQSVHIGPGAHPAFCPIIEGKSLADVKNIFTLPHIFKVKGTVTPVQTWTVMSWGFQEYEDLWFHDNRHMKVAKLSALRTGRLYPTGNIPGTHFC